MTDKTGKHYIALLPMALVLLSYLSCSNKESESDEELSGLVLSQDKFTVATAGSDISFTVQSSVSTFSYTLTDWIALKSTSTDKNAPVFTVSQNLSVLPRTGCIIYTAGSYKDSVTVEQTGSDASITADKTGMSSDAMTLYKQMGIGWNLGNSLEACSSSTSASETLWGNPKTTQALIDAVKAAGFNTVRIPCAWSGYIEDETTYRIKDSWLARVKEVVDYCIKNDMYAILNIHWDGGWLQDHANYTYQEAVNKKQKALWQQIAVYFRNYDEHLLFAGTNEVTSASNTSMTEAIAVQQSYNQTFVDAVRATGGKNTWRNLVIQSYVTNIDYANTYMGMSTDATVNRLMAEVHYYDPWDYCGLTADATWGTVKYLWGKEGGYGQYATISDWGQEDWVRQQFGLMKTKFVDKDIPVVLGEFGALYRVLSDSTMQQYHIASRNYYLNYVTKQALANGMVPIYWDNGVTGDKGFGLFNRNTNAVVHADAVNAIIRAGN